MINKIKNIFQKHISILLSLLLLVISFSALPSVFSQETSSRNQDITANQDVASKKTLQDVFNIPSVVESRKGQYEKTWDCQKKERSILSHQTDTCIDKVFGDLGKDRSSLSGKIFFIGDQVRYIPRLWTHVEGGKSFLDILHPKGITDFTILTLDSVEYSPVNNVASTLAVLASEYRKTPKESLVAGAFDWVSERLVLVDGKLVRPNINTEDITSHGCFISSLPSGGATAGLKDDPLVGMTNAEVVSVKKLINDEDACVLFVGQIEANQTSAHSSSSKCGPHLGNLCFYAPGSFTLPMKSMSGESYGNRIYSYNASVIPYVSEVFARTWAALPDGTSVSEVKDILLGCRYGFAGTAQANKKVDAGGRLNLECIKEQIWIRNFIDIIKDGNPPFCPRVEAEAGNESNSSKDV